MNDARTFFCEKLLLQSHTKVHMQKEKNGHGPQLDSINAIAFTSKTQRTHTREDLRTHSWTFRGWKWKASVTVTG